MAHRLGRASPRAFAACALGLPLLAVQASNLAEGERPRVAIVGGGIAGSSIAWFLRDAGVDITVFEASQVGGRVRELQFPKENPITVEAGGAAIHSLNKYMADFIDVLGLHRTTDDDEDRGGSRLSALQSSGIASWDGQKLSTVGPFNYPLSLAKAWLMVKSVTSKWQGIYDLQAGNVSFDHPHDMLDKLGLADLAQQSAREWFRGKVSDKFVEQFADGVSRVNYGQDSSLNAFAESISLAGAGLTGSLFGVREGNAKVMEGLIRESGATLRMERVTEVRARAVGGYDVCTPAGCEVFSSVALATPLELSNLKLAPELSPSVVDRPYQLTVATFVAARGLSSAFFGSGDDVLSAHTVVTTAASGIPFNSVADHGRAGNQTVYKMFSATVPSEDLIKTIFVDAAEDRAQFAWRAYPVLKPSPEWPSFRLHASASGGGLYYANAMESPVSCMETEAVGAKNVALLLQKDLPTAVHSQGEGGILV